jgi:hypothetical protein
MTARPLSLAEVQNLVQDPQQAVCCIESLLLTLACEDLELCAWASDALQNVRTMDPHTARRVVTYCMHEAAPTAVWACNLIGRLGTEVSCYQDTLVEALTEHPEIGVRQQAAASLGKVSGLSAVARQRLAEAAESDDPRLRRLAQTALDKARAA